MCSQSFQIYPQCITDLCYLFPKGFDCGILFSNFLRQFLDVSQSFLKMIFCPVDKLMTYETMGF